MKFGKRLHSQIEETLPEWRDKYLSYKQLKKRLKLLSIPDPAGTHIAHEPVEGLIRGGVGNNPVRFLAATCSSSSSSLVSTDSKNPSVNHGGGAVSVENGNLSSSANSTEIINPCQPLFSSADLDRSLTPEEVDFIHLLNAELDKFNSFFMRKEEEYVMRLQDLKERIKALTDRVSPASASSFQEDALNEEMINIRKDSVNFHGEMVLLENYSSLNYTGLVKILKKHDKRTGALLRTPFIQNVLHQPFFTTELLSKLVCECEMSLQLLFPTPSLCIEGNATMASKIEQDQADQLLHEERKEDSQDDTSELESSSDERRFAAINAQEQGSFHGDDVEGVHKSIIAALRTIKDIRRGSSTYSIFSLPPFSVKEDNEVGDTIVRNLQCLPLFCHHK